MELFVKCLQSKLGDKRQYQDCSIYETLKKCALSSAMKKLTHMVKCSKSWESVQNIDKVF
jgi:hypothetical protein